MKNIIDLFFNSSSEYYNKLTQLQVIFIFLSLIYIFTTFFNKTYGFIIILLAFILYLSETFIAVKNDLTLNENVTTMNKLIYLQNIIDKHIYKSIKKIQYETKNYNQNAYKYLFEKSRLNNFYIDTNMINFLYSISPMFKYNSLEFYKICIGTNNILKLKNEIEEFYKQNNDYPQNIAQMLEDAILLKSKCINNIHNFIYSIPKSNIMYNYIDSIIDRYTILITRNTDYIYKHYQKYNKKYGYNSSTKIITYNKTKPLDYFNDYNPIPKKSNKAIIDFYN